MFKRTPFCTANWGSLHYLGGSSTKKRTKSCSFFNWRRGIRLCERSEYISERECLHSEVTNTGSNINCKSNFLCRMHNWSQRKKNEHKVRILLAQRPGFEPGVRFRTQPFQDCTIDHSDISAYNIKL